MLELKNISTGYGKKQVLYNVSLKICQGELILITGSNGSGKSTLLKCIYNLLPCWTGNIFFNGIKIDELKPSDLIKLGIVYIPQKNFYFEELTVEENLQISGNSIKHSELDKRIAEVYELTELSKFKKRKPFDLSAGERKILALGIALINKPKLLMFDEPLSGLSIRNTEIMVRTITMLNMSGVSFLIVEHRMKKSRIDIKEIRLNLGQITGD
jgi:branched-chain amino acid transport system ATP-binding protein